MNITYGRKYISSVTYRSSGGLNPVCLTQVNNTLGPSSRTYTYNNSEIRTKVTGDRVHALPFTGQYLEHQPVQGTFKCRTHNGQEAAPDALRLCGDKAGSHTTYEVDVGFHVRTSTTLAPPPVDAALQRQLKAIAETKALADLRKSYVNVPLLLAERRETINLVAGNARRLTELVRIKQNDALARWRRSRRQDRRKLARDIANEHLAFLFGVLPLIDETKGLVEKLRASDTMTLTGRGRMAHESSSKTELVENPASLTAYAVRYSGQRVLTKRYSHRVSLRTEIEVAAAQQLRDWGFNPVATFYDLVPLSFVSDFVSNLGTFLRSYDPLVGVKFVTGSTTSWREMRENVDVVGLPKEWTNPEGKVNRLFCDGTGQGSVRALVVQREVLTDYPEATLLWYNNMSLGKAATLASLAVQRYLKPVRRLIQQKPFRYKGPRPRNLPNINYR